MRWGIIALVGGALLASTPARAQQTKEAEKRYDFRLGVSLLWAESAANTAMYGQIGSAGFFPLEFGVGRRLTDQIAVAALARVGILHVGGGIELTVTTADWTHDGPVFRVAPMLLSDQLSCPVSDLVTNHCASALYLLGEFGVQYRWAFRSGGGTSLGIVLNVGAVRLAGTSGATAAITGGVVLPRLQIEF
jgi:hypothetical protein